MFLVYCVTLPTGIDFVVIVFVIKHFKSRLTIYFSILIYRKRYMKLRIYDAILNFFRRSWKKPEETTVEPKDMYAIDAQLFYLITSTGIIDDVKRDQTDRYKRNSIIVLIRRKTKI